MEGSSMTDFDLAMAAIVASASVWGAYHGFVRQATTFGAWSVGLAAAAFLRQPVAAWLGGTAPVNEIGAAIILWFAASLAVHICGSQVREWIESAKLQTLDCQLGLALGALKGVALAALVTIGGYQWNEPARATIAQSLTARQISSIAKQVEPLVLSPADEWVVQKAQERIRILNPQHSAANTQ
jgi:uncharacterized membrane protein required for colicin V production